VHVARRRAEQINAAAAAAEAAPPPQGVAAGAAAAADAPAPVLPRAAFFVDQFESESNARAHALHTGPEIWAQTRAWWRARPRRREREDATYAAAAGDGAAGAPTARVGARDRLGAERVDAFVMGAGTGGTLAGVAGFLRRASGGAARAVLVDPPGSVLLALVRFGVAFAPQQAERALRRHRSDSVVEGVGLDRVSKNVAAALPLLSGAVPCADAEAVRMARHLLRREGLFLGGSSALNCVGAVKVARKLGPGHTVVTVLCDRGERHVSRCWSDDVLRARGLPVAGKEGGGEGGDDDDDDDLSFVRRDDEDGDASNEAVGGAGATGAGAGAGGAKAERDLFKP
jgi:cysteine synthase A